MGEESKKRKSILEKYKPKKRIDDIKAENVKCLLKILGFFVLTIFILFVIVIGGIWIKDMVVIAQVTEMRKLSAKVEADLKKFPMRVHFEKIGYENTYNPQDKEYEDYSLLKLKDNSIFLGKPRSDALLEKAEEFYSKRFSDLLTIIGVGLAIFGLAIPLILYVAQSIHASSDREKFKDEIEDEKERIYRDIGEWLEKQKEELETLQGKLETAENNLKKQNEKMESMQSELEDASTTIGKQNENIKNITENLFQETARLNVINLKNEIEKLDFSLENSEFKTKKEYYFDICCRDIADIIAQFCDSMGKIKKPKGIGLLNLFLFDLYHKIDELHHQILHIPDKFETETNEQHFFISRPLDLKQLLDLPCMQHENINFSSLLYIVNNCQIKKINEKLKTLYASIDLKKQRATENKKSSDKGGGDS